MRRLFRAESFEGWWGHRAAAFWQSHCQGKSIQMYSKIPPFKATLPLGRRCLDSVLSTWSCHLKPVSHQTLIRLANQHFWRVWIWIINASKFNVPCNSGEQAVPETYGFDVNANLSDVPPCRFTTAPQRVQNRNLKAACACKKVLQIISATWGEIVFLGLSSAHSNSHKLS